MSQSTARGQMIAIPAADVCVGSPERHLDDLAVAQHYERDWFEDEAPQHTVRVDRFWIDSHLVTNAEFTEFAADTGYVTVAERRGFGLVYGESYWEEVPEVCWRHPGGRADTVQDRLDHPVVHVAYQDAAAYAEWAGKRLPTEAEWEYAAHGPQWRCWPWGDRWDPSLANCAEYWSGSRISNPDDWRTWWTQYWKTSGGRPATTSVGSFSPLGDSVFGVADMAGNVSEWVDSAYSLYDPSRSYLPNYEMAVGRYRVIRSGSWMNFRYQLRTSERFAADPRYSNLSIGFRCASGDEPA
jgi:formylglycine-generating enzyme